VALTNTNSIHEQIWRIRYQETLSHFDKIFCSHELKARKPEAAAYQSVLNYLGVKPQHTIFLDDSAANIAGAVRLGIATILVTSQQQMHTDLGQMLYPHWRGFSAA